MTLVKFANVFPMIDQKTLLGKEDITDFTDDFGRYRLRKIRQEEYDRAVLYSSDGHELNKDEVIVTSDDHLIVTETYVDYDANRNDDNKYVDNDGRIINRNKWLEFVTKTYEVRYNFVDKQPFEAILTVIDSYDDSIIVIDETTDIGYEIKTTDMLNILRYCEVKDGKITGIFTIVHKGISLFLKHATGV